jgi:hypothetical protein
VKPIIVGYDPGTTAAIAILDTKGQILLLKSKRSFKQSEIIDLIMGIGKPLMIAGDRHPLPKSVEKLASSLGCKAYRPMKTLSVSEKEKLVNEFAGKIKDEHVKDALASAIKVFNVYSKVFERTKNLLSSLGLSELYEKVIDLVLRGEVENINEAVNRLLIDLRKKQEIPRISKVIEKEPLNKNISRLQERIKSLEKDLIIIKQYNQSLKNKLKESEDILERHRKKLAEKTDVGSLKFIEKLKSELKEKESLIEFMKSSRNLELNGYVPMLEVNEINDSIIKGLDQKFDLLDKVILVNKLDNAQILNDYRIKALITMAEPGKEILEKVDFPIIAKKDISIEKVKDISVVKKDEFEEVLKKVRKTGFVQWIEGHKKRRL